MASPPRPGAPQAHAPRPLASTPAPATTTTHPWTDSPAQLTPTSEPGSASPTSTRSAPFSLRSTHLRPRPPADTGNPTLDRPSDAFAASAYAHRAEGEALFGPPPRSPLVAPPRRPSAARDDGDDGARARGVHERERARLRTKYALKPEQEEVLGRMMQGVWERLGGEPHRGQGSAQLRRVQEDQPRPAPPETPDLSSLASSKAASPAQPALSLPNSPPSTRTSVYDVRGDAWAADERLDLRPPAGARTPFASTTPLGSPPVVMTPAGSPRSTYRSRPPSPLPVRSTSVSPPPSPPPGAASPRPADRTLTPMPSPPVAPLSGASFPHLDRERAPLFRALGWSYLPARSGLRTQRAPLVDGELGVEEREWAERTRRVPDDGGLRDWWGNPVGLGGGDWGRAVLSPILTETEPTHSSPALSFRSGASYLSRSSIHRRDPHKQQQHRRALSVPPELLDYVDAGSARPRASRSARLERAGPRSPGSSPEYGLVVPLGESSAADSSKPLCCGTDDVSSFAASAGRPPSEPFFGGGPSVAPSTALGDPSLASRRPLSVVAQSSIHNGAPARGDETASYRSRGASVLPPGIEYDPSLTASDYAHAGLDLVSPLHDDSFFLGGGDDVLMAPTAASTTSRRSRAASSGQNRLSAGPSSDDGSHFRSPVSPSSASQYELGAGSRAGRSSGALAGEDDAAGRESSSLGPAPTLIVEQQGGPLPLVEPSMSAQPSYAPSSSRRASRPSGSASRTDPQLYGSAPDSPSRLSSSSSSRARPHHIDAQSSLRRHDANRSSRRTPRSPLLDDGSLARPPSLQSPASRPHDHALNSPSSRSAMYSTVTGAPWASSPWSPSQQDGLAPFDGSSSATGRSWTDGAVEQAGPGMALAGLPELTPRARGRSTSALGETANTSTSRPTEPRPARTSRSPSSSRDDITRWASGVAVGASGDTSEPSQASSTERAGRSSGSSRTDLATPSSRRRLAVDRVEQNGGSTLSPRRASNDSSSRSPTKSSAPRSISRAGNIVSPSSTTRTSSEYVSATEYLSASGEPTSSSSRPRLAQDSTSTYRSPPPASSPFYGAADRSHSELYSPSAQLSRSAPSSVVLSPESSLFGIGSPTSTPPQRRALVSFGPGGVETIDSPIEIGPAASAGGGRRSPRRTAAVPSGHPHHGLDASIPLDEVTTTSSPRSPPLVPTEVVSSHSPIHPDQPTTFFEQPPPPSPRVHDWDEPVAPPTCRPADDGLGGYADTNVHSPHGPPHPAESPCSSPSRSTYSSSSKRAAVEPKRYVARPPVKPARRGPGPFPVPQLSEEEKHARRELRRAGRSAEWELSVSETKSGRRKAAWDEMQAFDKERARLFKLLGDPLSARDVPVLNALAALYLDSTNPAVRAQAIQLLQNSLQLNEIQPETARLLALQLEDVDVEEALSWHRFAVEQGPESPERHLSLGHCLLRAGDPGEASHVFLTIARSFTDEPYEAIALYELGRLYQQYGAGWPVERANAIEAFEGALACLTRLCLESPETRLGDRWDELELVERAVLRGLQEVRDGQRGPSASPFSSKHATPRGPLSPVVSTKARLPPPPRQPAPPHLVTPPASAAPPSRPTSSPSTSPQRHRHHADVVEVASPSRSPTLLNETVPASKPVRPPRRRRRKVDPETARTLDTILSSLSRLSRTMPAADLADSTRTLAKQVEETYLGLKKVSGEEAAQQDELFETLDEVQRMLGALPHKLVSQAKLIAARPSGAPPPPPTALERDPLETARCKLERARALVV